MKSFALAGLVGTSVLFASAAPAQAQTAGSTTVAVIQSVADGWSVKKQFLGTTVYNEAQAKVGKVEDVIIAPDGAASFAIIGAGGFIGVGRHNVAVPIDQLKMMDDKMVLPGATKELVKGMPEFKYASKADRKL